VTRSPQAAAPPFRRARGRERGSVLIASLIAMVVLSFLAVTLAQIVCDEEQISINAVESEEALHLADSGVGEALWRFARDDHWRARLESDGSWTETIARTSAEGLPLNRSYLVRAEGRGRGSALITSTGTIRRSSGSARRVVEVYVVQGYDHGNHYTVGAMMATGKDNTASGGPGNVHINAPVDIAGGLTANHTLYVRNRASKGSKIDTRPVVYDKKGKWTTGDALPFPDNVSGLAVHGVNVSTGSVVVDGYTVDQDYDGSAAPGDMPSIDFGRFRQDADRYLTSGQLEALLDSGPVVLDGITYVRGGVRVDSKQDLRIRGLLVADGNVAVAKGGELTVDPNPLKDEWKNACGVLSRGDIKISDDFKVSGLVYALKNVHLKSEKGGDREIRGALVASDIHLGGSEPIRIVLDPKTRGYISAVLQEGGGAAGETETLKAVIWKELY
jgi:hypothetical protein